MSYQPVSGPALVMHQGPRPNSTFSLNKETITIGRTPDNDLVIDDVELSRRHARLVRSGQDWLLEDLGSTNGTFVNGQRVIHPVLLTPGVQIAFGHNVLFSLQGAPVPSAYPPGPAQAVPAHTGGFPWLVAGIAAACLLVLLVLAGLAASFLLSRRQAGAPTLDSLAATTARGPDVALQEPANDTWVNLGETVLVFALAREEKGVTRMELWVDGAVVAQQDSPVPSGLTPLSLVYTWPASTPGTKMLMARAFNSQGAMGMSPVVYLNVTDQLAEPPLGEYVVQPGDTLPGVAAEMSTTVPALEESNPALGQTITPGQSIVVPIPTVELPTPTLEPPTPTVQAPPPPQPPPPQPPQPPTSPPNAPNLISATTQDCSVTLTWQDQADNELGFLVYRASGGAPGFALLSKTADAAPGAGSQVHYLDQAPKPGSYAYYVVAANAAGQGASNLRVLNVPPSGACVQPPGYKQVMFQPLKLKPTDPNYISAALFYALAGSVYRRIPEGNGTSYLVGDWSGFAQAAAAPASVYLNPTDPVLMFVASTGWPVAANLGQFYKSHSQGEMTPANTFHGHGQGFDLDYGLWLEDVTWGQGSTDQIPPPTNLRLATTAAELAHMGQCQGSPCDPMTTRALVWDWTGDLATIDGYMLYRFYSCPNQDTPLSAPELVGGPTEKGRTVPAWSVPSGCAARYQVSAVGPAGESAPSAPLDLAAAAPLARLPVTFKSLTLTNLPPAGAWRRLIVTANQYLRWSPNLLFQNGVAKDLDMVIFDGKAPNNTVVVGLGPGDALQYGFELRNGVTNATICKDTIITPPPAGNNWAMLAGHTYHINGNPDCDLTVDLGQLQAVSAGQASRPQSALMVMPVPFVLIGQDVYVQIMNPGPDDLLNNNAQISTYWIDPNTNQPVNAQTAVHSINLPVNFPGGLVWVDSVPPAYAALNPLPQFHLEWNPVDFDYVGTANKVVQGAPQVP